MICELLINEGSVSADISFKGKYPVRRLLIFNNTNIPVRYNGDLIMYSSNINVTFESYFGYPNSQNFTINLPAGGYVAVLYDTIPNSEINEKYFTYLSGDI